MTMPIPTVTIERGDGRSVLAGDAVFKDWHMSSSNIRSLRDAVIDIVGRYERGTTVLMADVNSMEHRKLDISLLKELKTRKVSIWLMTYIEDADDLFDAFYMNIDSLIVPYHLTSSDAALKEMNTVSDRTIPAVFADGRTARSRLRDEPLEDVIRRIEDMGFHSVAVVETSGTYDDGMWKELFDRHEMIIPFAPGGEKTAKALGEMGFKDVVML